MEVGRAAALLALLCLAAGLQPGWAQLDEVQSPAFVKAATEQHAGMPQGGAWIDVDNDGDLDFVFPGDPGRGIHLQLLKYNEKKGTFDAKPLDKKIRKLPDATKLGNRTSVIAADFDNDGTTDLYLSGCETTVYTGTPLPCSTGIFFKNLGNGKFTAKENAGLKPSVYEIGTTVGDANGDGLLDLYVPDATTYPRDNSALRDVHTNKLYINKGKFKFEDSEADVHVSGSCVTTFVDFDYDGDQDLVVAPCNRIDPNPENPDIGIPKPGSIVLLKNVIKETGQLGFEDVSDALFGTLQPSLMMAISMADINNDGKIDFFFGNVDPAPTVLPHLMMVSQPDGTYRNESDERGLAHHSFNWGSAFLDVDNDGDQDLVTVGGWFGFKMIFKNPGTVLLNDGTGKFTVVQELGLNELETGGVSVGDFDVDGSQDVMVIGRIQTDPDAAEEYTDTGRLALFKGTAPKDRYVSIRLLGVQSNRLGIGAFVNVCPSKKGNGNGNRKNGQSGAPCQQQVSTAGSGYSSSHSSIFHFGIAQGVNSVDVTVFWPSGQQDTHKNVPVGSRYMLQEGADSPVVE